MLTKTKRLFIFACLTLPLASPATPLVTGNGFGFAVLSPGAISKFYVHPYKFTKPNTQDPYGAGFETENLLKSMSWSGDDATPTAEFQDESQILREQGSAFQHSYFMPFGLKQPALVTVRQATGPQQACLLIDWRHPVRNSKLLNVGGREAEWVTFSDIQESALVVPLSTGDFSAKCLKGDAWAVIALENSQELNSALADVLQWQKGLSPSQLVQRELSEVENWRVKPKISFKSDLERKLWRQSEIILRMAQSREINRPGRYNHGLIVASLPEGGWFMPWVRDMSYAALALLRMGHKTEARWALEGYFNARPIGRVKNMVRGFPYQISVVRYFGDGSEETDFGGENAPNVEFDAWGLVLNLLGEYVNTYGDVGFLSAAGVRGSVYVSARDYVVKPLLGNMDPIGVDGKIVTKDTSIWEANAGSEQHFAFSSVMAVRGLREFSSLAQKMGDIREWRTVEKNIGQLEKGFTQAFVPDGYVHGTMEDNPVYNVDSAVLEAFNFDVMTDKKVVTKTLDTMELLKMPSGGYRRIRGDRQYDIQEFVFCDFNWARNYIRLGQTEKAAPLMDTVVQRSMLDHGFIPEMYVSQINDEYPGAIGAPTGSIPMVGFGAGMYVIYALERASLGLEH